MALGKQQTTIRSPLFIRKSPKAIIPFPSLITPLIIAALGNATSLINVLQTPDVDLL